jgi:hypothetical protein
MRCEFGDKTLVVMSPEPRWRVALNWGVVITFFSLPLILFTLHIFYLEFPNSIPLAGHGKEFSYLGEFSRNVTILTFGLAGLNSFDRHKQNGKNGTKGATQSTSW